MEAATFLGMLGLGYALSDKDKKKEGFEAAPALTNNYTSYASIVPGVAVQQPPLRYEAPVGLRSNSSNKLDQMYTFPAKERIPSEPVPGKQGGYLGFPVPAVKTEAVTSSVYLNTNGQESTPVLTKGAVVSQLTGLTMKPEEFTHANMVPFFRGSPKQNMTDTANRNVLDTYTGGGAFQQQKREQGPMFESMKSPTGVPFGSEIATDYMQERVVAPTNRAGERPFEQVRVGKGLGQGFTSFPSGGYQQADSLDYARPRSTDEIRTANNPKQTYEGVVVPGAHFVTNRGKLGEVRKNLPDKFYINEKGERNFTTTGANLKATERPVQVLRETTRPETTQEYSGSAKSADFSATYTVPSTRAPMVKQAGSWGFRNADATNYFDKNTDSDQNDYGKAAIEIRPNERFYTGERGQTLNMKPAETGQVALPQQDGPRQTRKDEMLGNPNQAGYMNVGGGIMKMTIYDPDDVARTTIKETTVDNDYLGIAAPNQPQKLTTYDPEDIARVTQRNTTDNVDYNRNAATADSPDAPYTPFIDIAKVTQRNTIDNFDTTRNFGTADSPDAPYIPYTDIARVTDREELSAKSEYYGNSDPNYPKGIVNPFQDGARKTQKAAISANSAYTGSGYAEDKKQIVNPYQDGARQTQKAAISAKSAYTGSAGTANAKAPRSETAEKNMRHYAQRENVAVGRKPSGNIALFNGEDYINMKFNKIESDYINDRSPIVDRVRGAPPSEESIGMLRPRAVLKLDVSSERMEPAVVSGLETNPYVIPLHSTADKVAKKQVRYDTAQSIQVY